MRKERKPWQLQGQLTLVFGVREYKYCMLMRISQCVRTPPEVRSIKGSPFSELAGVGTRECAGVIGGRNVTGE